MKIDSLERNGHWKETIFSDRFMYCSQIANSNCTDGILIIEDLSFTVWRSLSAILAVGKEGGEIWLAFQCLTGNLTSAMDRDSRFGDWLRNHGCTTLKNISVVKNFYDEFWIIGEITMEKWPTILKEAPARWSSADRWSHGIRGGRLLLQAEWHWTAGGKRIIVWAVRYSKQVRKVLSSALRKAVTCFCTINSEGEWLW